MVFAVCLYTSYKQITIGKYFSNEQSSAALRHAQFEVKAVIANAFQQFHSTVFALNCHRSGLHIIGL